VVAEKTDDYCDSKQADAILSHKDNVSQFSQQLLTALKPISIFNTHKRMQGPKAFRCEEQSQRI
jgi:hypothetical protein